MILPRPVQYLIWGGSMLSGRVCFLVVCTLQAVSTPALAQNQSQNQNQKPAAVQQKPTAMQQLQYSNQGAAQRNHAFEATPRPANPVQAQPAAKPSPVGQPIHSTANNPGYKPAPPALHINPVPLPASIARSTTTASSPPPTVARSTTTATVPPKKP
jgi:hypothetical protein